MCAGGRFVRGDALAKGTEHPFPGRGEQQRVTAGVTVPVAPDDEPGGDGPRRRRPDRGVLEPDATGQGRYTAGRRVSPGRETTDVSRLTEVWRKSWRALPVGR